MKILHRKEKFWLRQMLKLLAFTLNANLILFHNMFGKLAIARFQALICEWLKTQSGSVVAGCLLCIPHVKCDVIKTHKLSTTWLKVIKMKMFECKLFVFYLKNRKRNLFDWKLISIEKTKKKPRNLFKIMRIYSLLALYRCMSSGNRKLNDIFLFCLQFWTWSK